MTKTTNATATATTTTKNAGKKTAKNTKENKTATIPRVFLVDTTNSANKQTAKDDAKLELARQKRLASAAEKQRIANNASKKTTVWQPRSNAVFYPISKRLDDKLDELASQKKDPRVVVQKK